jgi:predicted small secreted protein
MNKKTLPLLFLFAALTSFFTAACNTMHGAGRDIERAGEKIQDNANNHR